MADVPAPAAESSPEQRLAAFFTPEVAAKSEKAVSPTPESSESVAEQPKEEPPPEQASDEQPEEVEQEAIVELEHLGKKYEAPASLAKAFEENRKMATQAAQQTAELKRQIDTREQAFALQQQFQVESKDDFESLSQIKGAIKAREDYLKANYRDLDPKDFGTQQYEIKMLEDAAKLKESELKTKYLMFDQKQQKIRNEAIAKGTEYLRKSISGFGQKHAADIVNYAVGNGYAKDEIDQALDPRVLRDIWKAAQWDALQGQRTAAVQRGQTVPPAIKPTSTASGDANKVRQINEQRARLKKSGSIEDAAALLLRLGK